MDARAKKMDQEVVENISCFRRVQIGPIEKILEQFKKLAKCKMSHLIQIKPTASFKKCSNLLILSWENVEKTCSKLPIFSWENLEKFTKILRP